MTHMPNHLEYTAPMIYKRGREAQSLPPSDKAHCHTEIRLFPGKPFEGIPKDSPELYGDCLGLV